MKIPEILKDLAEMPTPTAVTVRSPIKIGKADITAAELLLWLFAKMEDSTLGEVHEVLDAAKWWATTVHGSVPIDKETAAVKSE